jgi:dCMP deaminase
MPDGRPGWDAWAMAIAGAVSLRGDCTRRQVGAVIIGAKHEIVSIGYNGVAPDHPGCLQGACPRGRLTVDQLPDGGDYDTPGQPGFCIATHAEMNCLIRADHEQLDNATLYVTLRPCNGCTKVARNTPLAQIIYADNGKLCRIFSDAEEWGRRAF